MRRYYSVSRSCKTEARYLQTDSDTEGARLAGVLASRQTISVGHYNNKLITGGSAAAIRRRATEMFVVSTSDLLAPAAPRASSIPHVQPPWPTA